jgi:hypothetical protein
MTNVIQFESANAKLKVDFSQNFSKIQGVVQCPCGETIILDENITDAILDFENEKIKAKDKKVKEK